MSTISTRTRSFLIIAAWYSLLVPPTAIAIAIAIFALEGETRHHQFGDPAITIAFCVSISGLALAVGSLFSLRRHRIRAILWPALIGILASSFCGLYAALGIVARIANQ